LIKIIQNPIVAAHNARIILITNPPVDERTQLMIDQAKGYPMRRTAENSMRYAEAIRNVGKSLNIPVVDIWTEIMLKAGWTPGQREHLPGCRDDPPNKVLAEYLFDGIRANPLRYSEQLLADSKSAGLHLSPTGYRLLYGKICECIATNWPDQLPQNLPYILPPWDDGDAWRLRGETDSVINHRPRVFVTPISTANGVSNGSR
jgi:lysophospholipase L1-like esterase